MQVKGAATGTFNADINVEVDGDVQFEENQGTVFVDAARIAGDIDVVKNTGDVEVEFNRVGGNISVQDNVPTLSMSITFNQVGGNIGVFKNTGPGAKRVGANVVAENAVLRQRPALRRHRQRRRQRRGAVQQRLTVIRPTCRGGPRSPGASAAGGGPAVRPRWPASARTGRRGRSRNG